MAQLQELQIQPVIPYNVLASPPMGNVDDLPTLAEELKQAWESFQKTGNLNFTAFQQGLAAAGGGSFNYLALLQAAIGLAGTVGAEIPGVAIAAPLVSILLGFLWPNKQKSDIKQLITVIDAEVKRILNQELTDYHSQEVQGYLEGFFDTMTNPATSPDIKINESIFTGMPGDPNRTPKDVDATAYDAVVDRFLTANVSFIIDLDQFLTGKFGTNNDVNFDVASLPYYVIGATLQLMSYHSVINFMTAWFPKIWPQYTTEDSRYKDILNAKQAMRMAIRDNTNKVLTIVQANLPSLGSTRNSLNDYNRYARTMQLTCLDTVAQWPTLYPDDYPVSTTLEQTRRIFLDTAGIDERKDSNGKYTNDSTITALYNILDGNSYNSHNNVGINGINSLLYSQDELKSITYRMTYTNNNDYGQYPCFPYGVVLGYTNNQYPSNPAYGNGGDPNNGSYIDSPNTSAPFHTVDAATQNTMYIDAQNMFTDSNPTGCNILNYGGPNGGKSNNPTLATQKIDTLFPFTINNPPGSTKNGLGRLGVMASLVPYNLSPNNVFGEFDSDTQAIIAKGFPAEKGYIDNGSPVSVVKEWVNGANAVQLPAWNTFKITATNLAAGQYRIRVRYANPGPDLLLHQYVYAGDNEVQGGAWTFKSTTDSNVNTNFPNQVYVTGQQGNYVLEDITWPMGGGPSDPLTLPAGDVTVQLFLGDFSQQGQMTQVFIDRIEFVPVGATFPSTIPISVNAQYNQGSVLLWQAPSSSYFIYNFDITGTLYGSQFTSVFFDLENPQGSSGIVPGINQSITLNPNGTDISYKNLTANLNSHGGFNLMRMEGAGSEDFGSNITGNLTITIHKDSTNS
ncbi:delta endotoxin C-terminal domain-containing protein [Bacillus cereus]|uniref:delta endotoxin C-terminal domain-containing protein n=1 Tax=Bacillus cereus TaxID=1396 RepID=UPI0009024703|nr:delta endotoxin C-terminal domain-containing protein [Bacillus cereus]